MLPTQHGAIALHGCNTPDLKLLRRRSGPRPARTSERVWRSCTTPRPGYQARLPNSLAPARGAASHHCSQNKASRCCTHWQPHRGFQYASGDRPALAVRSETPHSRRGSVAPFSGVQWTRDAPSRLPTGGRARRGMSDNPSSLLSGAARDGLRRGN